MTIGIPAAGIGAHVETRVNHRLAIHEQTLAVITELLSVGLAHDAQGSAPPASSREGGTYTYARIAMATMSAQIDGVARVDR
jgi:hypothetical protein